MTKLRNDIRRDLVFNERDAVAQLQLALLQPLQPQQIRRGRLMQGIDRRVEVAVLLLQSCALGFDVAPIFVGHVVREPENAMRLRRVGEAVEGISSLPAYSASWRGVVVERFSTFSRAESGTRSLSQNHTKIIGFCESEIRSRVGAPG